MPSIFQFYSFYLHILCSLSIKSDAPHHFVLIPQQQLIFVHTTTGSSTICGSMCRCQRVVGGATHWLLLLLLLIPQTCRASMPLHKDDAEAPAEAQVDQEGAGAVQEQQASGQVAQVDVERAALCRLQVARFPDVHNDCWRVTHGKH